MPKSARFCSFCDLSVEPEDNANHLILHCPTFQPQRDAMFMEIQTLTVFLGTYFLNDIEHTLFELLCKRKGNISYKHVHKIYQNNMQRRKGIELVLDTAVSLIPLMTVNRIL